MGRVYPAYSKLVDSNSEPTKELSDSLPEKEATKFRRSSSRLTVILYVLGTILAISVVLSLIGFTWGFFWTKYQVKRFTVTEPRHFPVYQLPSVELDIIADKAKLFIDTLRAGKVPEQDFTVTADELNAFIAHSDYLRGNAYVTVNDNQLLLELSLPAKGLPGGKGRYFVATGSVAISKDTFAEDSDRAIITTQLETVDKVKDLDGPIWFAEFAMFRENPREIHGLTSLVVTLLDGKFMNWKVPADYIDRQDNLINYIFEDEDCPPNLPNVLEGMQAISLANNEVTLHAERPEQLKEEVYQNDEEWNESIDTVGILERDETLVDAKQRPFGARKLLKLFLF